MAVGRIDATHNDYYELGDIIDLGGGSSTGFEVESSQFISGTRFDFLNDYLSDTPFTEFTLVVPKHLREGQVLELFIDGTATMFIYDQTAKRVGTLYLTNASTSISFIPTRGISSSAGHRIFFRPEYTDSGTISGRRFCLINNLKLKVVAG